MSWTRLNVDVPCQGGPWGAQPACDRVIRAGEPVRLVAGGKVRWCDACALRKLEEPVPDEIFVTERSGVDTRARFERFTGAYLPFDPREGR